MYSQGLVHSNSRHIDKLINILKPIASLVVVHLITDGRDVQIHDFKEQLNAFKAKFACFNNVLLKSISGRFFAMDRDCRWKKNNKSL